MIDRTAHYIGNHRYMSLSPYSPNQVAAFICGGVWSFVDESQGENIDRETIRSQARGLLASLLASGGLPSTNGTDAG